MNELVIKSGDKPHQIQVRTDHGTDFFLCAAYSVVEGLLLVSSPTDTENIVATYNNWDSAMEAEAVFVKELNDDIL